MRQVYLFRDAISKNPNESGIVTRGAILFEDYGDVAFHTLELPWQNNEKNISCIPPGDYKVDFMAESGTGKYKKIWWIRNVSGRSEILIHNGNFSRNTKGCILIGCRAGYIHNEPAVLNSKAALGQFYKIMGEESFNLSVIGGTS